MLASQHLDASLLKDNAQSPHAGQSLAPYWTIMVGKKVHCHTVSARNGQHEENFFLTNSQLSFDVSSFGDVLPKLPIS